jgi:hypothetical protein
MVAVALVAVSLVYVEILRQLSWSYSRKADEHSWSWSAHWVETTGGFGLSYKPTGRAFPDDDEYFSYHERLRLKYERAARYPWLLVEPDPPPPVPFPARLPPGASRSPFDLDVDPR